MQSIPWTLVVQTTAVANGLMLAGVLAVEPRLRTSRSARRLAGLLACIVAALAAFMAMDHGWVAVGPAPVALEYGCAVLAGVLLVDFVGGDRVGRVGFAVLYLLPLCFLPLALTNDEWLLSERALVLTLLIQLALTGLATVLFVRGGRRSTHSVGARWLLAGFWSFHLFQGARLLFPAFPGLFDAVPLFAACLLIAASILVARKSSALHALTRPIAVLEPDADRLVQLDAFMRAEKPFLDPSLDLDQLAAAWKVRPRELSRLLRAGGRGFYEFVQGHRVAEACRLLVDPDERRTSIEAIGLLVGFRARSTFYEAFRRAIGTTPAAYRRAHQPNEDTLSV